MKRYMETDSPLVTVVLAVYNPNKIWLREQLISIKDQDYCNLELLICDDCPEHPLDEAIVRQCIGNVRYEVIRNDINIGSNKTFERLTLAAGGEYIAYCDQDDIWRSDKISVLMESITRTGAVICYSDLYIMDENGKRTNNSIKEIRKRTVFRYGKGIAKDLLVSNCVTGCAMIIRADIAKAAVPFSDDMVHDHWLAVYGALHGEVVFIPDTLVGYRQHGFNQTGILTGVTDKQSYCNIRLVGLKNRIQSLSDRLSGYDELSETLQQLSLWVEARVRYFNRVSLMDLWIMLRYRSYGVHPIKIESVMPFLPEFVFRRILRLAQDKKI